MITIDGSSAGGQLLRTSLSLSALTKKPFKMINIRSNRQSPGLRHQHLTAVNAIAKICNAKVKGNELHSHELEFIPNDINPGDYKFDIGTAGSTTLVLETLIVPLSFAKEMSTLEIIGATANPWAPPVLDIKEVFLWHLDKLGIKADLKIEKEGFYPKGGGKIKTTINLCKGIKEIKLAEPKHGNYKETGIIAVCSHELKQKDVAKRLIKGFKSNFPVEYKIKTEEKYAETLSPGCYIHANYSYNDCKLGMSILGEKSKKAEDVGRECALNLLREMKSGATTDHFTADQLLIYMGIKGSGKIKVSQVTEHMKTNIEVIKKFLDVNFSIEGGVIKCTKL